MDERRVHEANEISSRTRTREKKSSKGDETESQDEPMDVDEFVHGAGIDSPSSLLQCFHLNLNHKSLEGYISKPHQSRLPDTL